MKQDIYNIKQCLISFLLVLVVWREHNKLTWIASNIQEENFGKKENDILRSNT